MTLDGVTSFSRIRKIYEINVNASIAVKVLSGIYFHVMTELWKHVKDTLAFSLFIV